MATELIQGYNWKSISKRSLLKVDLKKAFDSLNWSFILLILKALSFPESLINLIEQCITTTWFSVLINDEIGGYFKGSRGLRKGDPLSPYLFVLSMEVLAQLLKKNFAEGNIGYHPAADNPEITHLAFADDLMIFFDGQRSSLQQIADTMDSFASWSGLTMNKDKTELFVAGMSQIETSDLSTLGFSLGSLPVRYLGLPLMHRKLRISDYRPLLDQLKRRFSSWSSRALSFAGRRQLLATVIFGILNFWFSSFVLPKGCVNEIESLCSRFLWNGNITSRAAAKVSWRVVCLPRKEGGLDLRDLHTWNKTLSLKLVWLLHSESQSLWAFWSKRHRLKGTSVWSMDDKKQSAWIWKSILKLRPLAQRFLRCDVGNGLLVSFWYDYWLPFGPLIQMFGADGPRQLGIHIHAKVADCCTSSGWRLRPARSIQTEQLQIALCFVPLPSLSTTTDSYKWYVNDLYLDSFCSRRTWDSVRTRGDVVDWEPVVWFGGHVPRQAFHMWVTHLDRLPTRSRIATWSDIPDKSCLLCIVFEECRDHLFLRCPFSEQVWRFIIKKLGYQSILFHT